MHTYCDDRGRSIMSVFDHVPELPGQFNVSTMFAGAVPEVFQVDEAEPNLAALDEQTRRLINAAIFMAGAIGLWATWSEVLPAFSVLERFALWHYKGLVDGGEQSIPVTLADISLVVLILVVATIAARNLPGLLEILLLQSHAFSAGARYTIKTLSS